MGHHVADSTGGTGAGSLTEEREGSQVGRPNNNTGAMGCSGPDGG